MYSLFTADGSRLSQKVWIMLCNNIHSYSYRFYGYGPVFVSV